MARPVTNPATMLEQGIGNFVIEKLKDHDTLQGILDAAGVSVGGAGGAAEIITIDREGVEIGKVENPHPMTKQVMDTALAGIPVYMYGPAGSGKSTIAQNVAEALSLPCVVQGKIEFAEAMLGQRFGYGNYEPTPFRKIWESGGVFAWDEMDRSDASAVTALNDGLSSGVMTFPDGETVKKHEKCHIIASGNSNMLGDAEGFVAAVQHDAAVRDRFAFIEIEYNESFERTLVPGRFAYWSDRVISIRKAAAALGIADVLATPRATVNGAKLLHNGMKQSDVETMLIFKGIDAASVKQIRRKADDMAEEE